MIYTASSEATWRRCQRQWWWRYHEGYALAAAPTALRVGTRWHECMEAIWEGKPWRAGVDITDHESAMLDALVEGYLLHHDYPTQEFDVLEVEVEFAAPLLDAELNPVEGWELRGKIDALARDRRTGQAWIVEHKTCGEDIEPGSDYWSRLALDAQLSTYVIGAEALGYPVAGIIYDVARKPSLRPATATKNIRLKKDGQPYAGQRLEDETPAEFRARVAAEIESRPGRYYQRQRVTRLSSQIREHLANMAAYAAQMATATERSRAPQNPAECHRFGRCAFWDVCATGSAPDAFAEVYERKAPHSELSEQGNSEEVDNDHSNDCPF